MLTAVLVATGLVAGLTGSWSPCGFSMVDTLAPHGYAGRLRVTLAACATFSAGALAGGAVTFGLLAVLGRALGAGGTAAAAVAGAVALAAAAGEARGARIVPQVRRQVPESWRRVMPVPLAAGLYGVLLGLGFTTFILTFAVWALAGVSIALGDPGLGLATGLAFGLGRLLPVIVLAPVAGTERGIAAHAAMAERPAILRGMRAVDAVALAACALVLVTDPARAATPPPAHAAGATILLRDATDPSLSGGTLAWHARGGSGFVRSASGHRRAAPGPRPAVGGGRVAWIADGAVHASGGDLPAALAIPDAGAQSVAVDGPWLAWLTTAGGRSSIRTVRLPTGTPGPQTPAPAGRTVGRPALSGDDLVYSRTTSGGAVIRMVALGTGAHTTLRRERRAMLLGPSARGSHLLYVRSAYNRQQLVLGPLHPASTASDRVLYSQVPTARHDNDHDPGHTNTEDTPGSHYPRPPVGRNDTLWNTALGAHDAYVTRLRQKTGHPVYAVILHISR